MSSAPNATARPTQPDRPELAAEPSLDPKRAYRAAEALAEGRVRIAPGTEPGVLIVDSFTGDGRYRVWPATRRPSCPDVRYRGIGICKHAAAPLTGGCRE